MVGESIPGIETFPDNSRYSRIHAWGLELNVLERRDTMMDMSAAHKELVERATTYLQELVPTATNITFEEFGTSLALENPPNAVAHGRFPPLCAWRGGQEDGACVLRPR